MSSTFIDAVASRALDAMSASALEAVTQRMLAEADAAVCSEPSSVVAWCARARVLVALGRYFDAMVSLQSVAATNGADATLEDTQSQVQAQFEATLHKLAPLEDRRRGP